MNFKKYFLIFAVLVCFAAFLTGCNNKNNDDTNPTPVPTPRTDNSIKFDFGYDASMTDENWITVTVPKKSGDGTTGYTYTKELGYGFVTPAEGKECNGGNDKKLTCTSESVPENVFKDYAILNNSEFVIDIENGTYTVQILAATTSSSLNYYTVEGQESDVSVDPDAIASVNFKNVTVTDGQLNISSTGTGLVGGLISGIVVVPLGNATELTGTADLKTPSCTLEWKDAENALSYNIYRTDRDGNTVVFNTTENSYTDTSVELINEYTYYVMAEAGIELESEPTNEIHLTTIDTSVSVPSAVTDLKVTALTAAATTLEWKASSDATKYYVYTADREFPDAKGVERYTLLGTTESTSFTVNRTTNIARYYKVFAANAGGLGEAALVRAEYGLTATTQVEKLDRGLVAVATNSGNYLSWRLAGEEYAKGATFEVYRDGTKIADISSTDNTNFLDTSGTASSSYTVKTYTDGKMIDEASTAPMAASYMDVPIQNPKNYNDVSAQYTYEANDMSVGDVDGDGVYELFLKWNPTNAKDNSHSGTTGPVFIDCYKLDGTLLWRIYLGVNIRAGAHYTQYMVYDFDGDGKCELICKTADGTIDGQGTVIGDASADYRNYGGYILEGPEYLTLFDCETGAILDTIDYNPPRGNVGSWGDGNGNRVDRFLAGVAYLDGQHPSAIICRGYYTRAVVVAYDVVNDKLVERWVCDSDVEGNEYLAGQGAHSLSVSDIDDDGCHEIVYGSASIDHDGTFMYSLYTANGPLNGGHGDALHVSDFNLDDASNEVFMVHENSPLKGGIEMHNGEDGVYVYNVTTTGDIGRGAAADLDPNYEGGESWADGMMRSATGEIISTTCPVANFVIYWDGDLGREILDSNYIYDWDYTNGTSKILMNLAGTSSNNGTKATPNLQADIFGDWREEVLMKTSDSSAIRIFTTTAECDYRLYTLMHDTQYRCAVAWQNTGYNQPPHTSFYIGFDEELMEVPVVNWEYAGN